MSIKHRPPIFTPGERLGATRLNRLARAAVAPSSGSSNPAASAALDVLQELEITALVTVGRTLTCRFAGATAGSTFSVAVPAIFKETSRGGVSYNYQADFNRRQATGTDIDEVQEITPRFEVGEVVLCMERTSVAGEPSFVFLGDGRMWARVP